MNTLLKFMPFFVDCVHCKAVNDYPIAFRNEDPYVCFECMDKMLKCDRCGEQHCKHQLIQGKRMCNPPYIGLFHSKSKIYEAARLLSSSGQDAGFSRR